MSILSASRQPDELIFHFDVEHGGIPLSHFIDAARGAEDILSCFNENFFDKKLKYEIHVRTPEHGSLIEVLALAVVVPGAVLKFLETDIGKAFFKGLTTKEPAEFAEEVGTRIREAVTKSAVKNTADQPQIEKPAAKSEKKPDDEQQRRIAAALVVLMLLGVLTSDSQKLSKVGLTPERFRTAYQGRNRFYTAAHANKEVKAIGFSREPEFAVQRSQFLKLITKLPDIVADVEETPSDLNFETVDIVVNSPNWKRDGRKWQAETSAKQEVTFSVEDATFWLRVERRDSDLRPAIRDNLRVQWAYPAGTGKPAHVRVLRVLSYNGRELAKPMTDQEIQAYQARLHYVPPPEPDLFDARRGTDNDNNKNDEGNP